MFEICQKKVLQFDNNWKFENIIALVFMFFGFMGWQFNYMIGAIPSIILSVILMFLTNKFKYSIPCIFALLFSYSNGYVIEDFPYDIVIPVAIYVIFIIIFTIKNFRISKFKSIKSYVGMIILSISFIIPIFWVSLIDDTNQVFYVMYFSWLLYLLLYLFLCINLDKTSFKLIVFTFTWLSVLITFELGIRVFEWLNENPGENILNFWGYLGWGLCNEAGIVLCFIMPFSVYELYKSNSYSYSIISILKIGIMIVGIVLTTSRGAYLFGLVEFVILAIIFLLSNSKLKNYKITISLLFISLMIAILSLKINYVELFEEVKNVVFSKHLDGNGREGIWNSGFERWMDSYKTIIFGSGIVSEIRDLTVFDIVQKSFVVYHNSLLEVLVSSGIIGLTGLGIHFAEKYTQLKGKGLAFILIFGVGYLIVDLYGLIDNTYGMYYYMVPLVITMAAFNNNDNFELFDNKKYGLF